VKVRTKWKERLEMERKTRNGKKDLKWKERLFNVVTLPCGNVKTLIHVKVRNEIESKGKEK
jgi:hypothetical protein